jgi:biopolymer transport protein ExbB
MNLSAPVPEMTSDLLIGASAVEGNFFFGDMDEVQISNTARPAAWLRAAARSQGPEGALCSFGEEELNDTGGLPVFYLGSILRNITLDGWVIIGMLMIISALSWVVFVSKTFVLTLMEKDNKAFLDSFRGVTDPIAMEEGDQDFQNSSLYGIYLAGRRELKSRLGNEEKCLPTRAFNAFKAALEKGLTMEIRKLNKGLLILTIAITGGPFLGLLGTVWGVMNTFAAMAAAGEANIMAIAPGIASALSTTVFGLIVAIPALFGYNYLTGRIKNITADMYIFVDEFDLKADETYGASS